jgi:hypothetical protein
MGVSTSEHCRDPIRSKIVTIFFSCRSSSRHVVDTFMSLSSPPAATFHDDGPWPRSPLHALGSKIEPNTMLPWAMIGPERSTAPWTAVNALPPLLSGGVRYYLGCGDPV